MTTSIWLRLRWLVPLLVLLVATPFASPAIFAYDASQQATVTYDERNTSFPAELGARCRHFRMV